MTQCIRSWKGENLSRNRTEFETFPPQITSFDVAKYLIRDKVFQATTVKIVYSYTPDFHHLLFLALLPICDYSPVFPLLSPNPLQFTLPTVEELSEDVEMEGKGTRENGSRPRSTAALGVCGVQSWGSGRVCVCVCVGGALSARKFIVSGDSAP